MNKSSVPLIVANHRILMYLEDAIDRNFINGFASHSRLMMCELVFSYLLIGTNT